MYSARRRVGKKMTATTQEEWTYQCSSVTENDEKNALWKWQFHRRTNRRKTYCRSSIDCYWSDSQSI